MCLCRGVVYEWVWGRVDVGGGLDGCVGGEGGGWSGVGWCGRASGQSYGYGLLSCLPALAGSLQACFLVGCVSGSQVGWLAGWLVN